MNRVTYKKEVKRFSRRKNYSLRENKAIASFFRMNKRSKKKLTRINFVE